MEQIGHPHIKLYQKNSRAKSWEAADIRQDKTTQVVPEAAYNNRYENPSPFFFLFPFPCVGSCPCLSHVTFLYPRGGGEVKVVESSFFFVSLGKRKENYLLCLHAPSEAIFITTPTVPLISWFSIIPLSPPTNPPTHHPIRLKCSYAFGSFSDESNR